MNSQTIAVSRMFFRASLITTLAALAGYPVLSIAQTTFDMLVNPNWNITLSDYGYSDYLLDNTPGFEGREYLSGEWGAAVGYTVGGTPVAPMWLDPDWWFPDWTTNSTFSVANPIGLSGYNADGLPIDESVIENAHLRITLRHEMLDTITGTPMGTAPLSAGGSGQHLMSNRYVLKTTYTIQNISGSTISGLQFFQFLHGLSSQRGVQDDRAYAGPLAGFVHDTTLAGVDPWSAGTNTSASGLEDYIGFHASIAPDAYEIGYYGIEGNGIDSHGIGKPSDGVHLSVETNWQTEPFLSREGTDLFQPAQRWVAGAQRWTLGSLVDNQSVSIDILLTILTGTKVATGTGSTGSCNGGSSVAGGLDYEFEDVSSEGSCFASYSKADAAEIDFRILEGEFTDITFFTPSDVAQVWEVDFTGSYSGNVMLTFGYDDTVLPAGFDEDTLAIYHFSEGAWVEQAGTIDPVLNTAWVTTPTFGPFILGITGSGSVPTYMIAVSESPAGSGTFTGDGSHAAGTTVSLAATPLPGYAFVNWTEGGSPVSASPNFTFTATGDRTLVANFVALNGDKAINTSSLPAEGGETSGGGAYVQGATATVHAVAAPGYKFSKWTEAGVEVSTSKDYTFTVDGDRALVAKFKQVFVITTLIAPPGGGETEVDPAYELGEIAKIKAVPASGWALVNWTQNGVPVSDKLIYEFSVTGNRTLTANFAQGYRIDVSAEPANGGSAQGGGVYSAGSTVTLTASAIWGYVFQDWSELVAPGVLSSPITTDAVYSFSSAAGRALVARFLALPGVAMEMGSPTQMVLSWPTAAETAGWVLEENATLDPGGWTTSTRPVTTAGPMHQVDVDTSAGPVFFRLSHP